ncbi:hypothetical protein G9A89_020728 [Geosiphon pyriformis]|nr:hypothetical protein G9A89_020728 [Geosiphon pyriformis]
MSNNTRDFEATELEANHAQAVNLSQLIYQLQSQVIYQPQQIQTPSQNLPQNGTQRLRLTQQSWRLLMVVYQLISSSSTQPAESRQWNLGTGYTQNLNSQNYLSLLVTPKDTQSNNLEIHQHLTLISNIPPATITKNESLDAIFLFKLKKPSTMPLFNGATLKEKPITAMYTNVKVDGHFIKLILDSESAGSIITNQLMDQLDYQVNHAASVRIITTNGTIKTFIGEIDDFLFEVNGIIISIKVLTTNSTTPLIKFEKEERKPTWKVYQVSWANTEHNKLSPVPSWDNNSKGKQSKKLT